MHVGLDLGTSSARILSVAHSELVGRRLSLHYCALPDDEDHRRWLTRAGIAFATCETHLLVFGEAAEQCARMLRRPLASLLPFGEVTGADLLERQILATQLERLLPKVETISGERICCFSHSGPTAAKGRGVSGRTQLLTQIVKLRGFAPVPVAPGMGLILAELAHEGFTGIGLVLGASRSELTVAHQGMELYTTSLEIGGDWIDEELARRLERYMHTPDGERILDTQGMKYWRERLAHPLLQPVNDTERQICELYAEYLTDLICSFAWRIQRETDLPRRKWILVCGGGLSRTPGMQELLQTVMREARFPLEIRDLQMSGANEFTITRGCLAQAHLEAEFRSQQRVA